jgi:hypothetical protein
MTRKTPEPATEAPAPEAAAGPVDNQPVTSIDCPFDLPQVGGSFTLEPGAKSPVPVPPEPGPEAPVEPPVKEA